MPHFIANDDIYRITFFCALEGQVSMNGVLCKVAAPGVPDCYDTDLADTLGTTFGPLFAAVIANTAGYYGLSVRREKGAGAQPRTIYNRTGAQAGTAGLVSLPKQAAGLLALYTERAGPEFQGRMYLPFPAQSSPTSGASQPNGAYILGGEDIGAVLIDTVRVKPAPANTFVTFGLRRKAPDEWNQFTDYRCRAFWATQERRGSYGRTNTLPF